MLSPGRKVQVHYKGTLDDGTVFDSSYDRGEPLEFVLGERKMLFGFEKAVMGMQVGDTVSIHLGPEDAFGPHRDNQIDRIPVESFPNADQLPVGAYIQMRVKGRNVRAKVVGVEDGEVILDYNHPLAGQAVNFEITLVDVEHKDALEEEREAHGCSCHRVADSLAAMHGHAHHHDHVHEHGCH